MIHHVPKWNIPSSSKRRNIGVGIGLSFGLPKRCRVKINTEILLLHASRLHQMRLALSWNIDCSRIVSQHADIFQRIRIGSVQEIRCMLRNGQASARDTTMCGITLLHTASSTGQLEVARDLIEAGADVNTPDEDGETPLHRALSLESNYDVARLLIENGADLANCAAGGRTPLHAIFNDTIGKVLMEGDWVEDVLPDSEGMSITHFLAWSSKTTLETFERGRARDTLDIWSTDASGRTCLHYAASRGNVDILTYLL